MAITTPAAETLDLHFFEPAVQIKRDRDQSHTNRRRQRTRVQLQSRARSFVTHLPEIGRTKKEKHAADRSINACQRIFVEIMAKIGHDLHSHRRHDLPKSPSSSPSSASPICSARDKLVRRIRVFSSLSSRG